MSLSSLVILIVIGIGTTLSCGERSRIAFDVRVDNDDSSKLWVMMTIPDVVPPKVVIRGFAPARFMRIMGVTATDGAGHPIEVREDYLTVTQDGVPVSTPRYILSTATRGPVFVRYKVWPGNREGDAERGFTGNIFGHAGPAWGLVRGRNLFMLPETAGRGGRYRFSMTVPEGMMTVTTLPRGPYLEHDEIEGPYASEDLLESSYAYGRFSVAHHRVGASQFFFALESSLSPDTLDALLPKLEAISDYLGEAFGDAPLKPYTIIAVPETEPGNQLAVESWRHGQAGTLVPLSQARLYAAAQGIADAYMRYGPYRDFIRRREELWIVDGSTRLLALKAMVKAKVLQDEDIWDYLEHGVRISAENSSVARNLEKLYDSKGPQRNAKSYLSPLVLLQVWHDPSVIPTAPDFETYVRQYLKSSGRASFWSMPPFDDVERRNRILERYVQHAGIHDDLRPARIRQTLSARSSNASEPEVDRRCVLYTSQVGGFLETCGCKNNAAGGVARLASLLADLRRSCPNTVVLDAGDALARPDMTAPQDPLDEMEQREYLTLMRLLRYDAAALGSSELAWPQDSFARLIRESGFRGYVGPSVRAMSHGPIRIHSQESKSVVRVYSMGPPAPLPISGNGLDVDGVDESDPLGIVCRQIGSQAVDGTDIVTGDLSGSSILRLARECAGIDMILSSRSLADFGGAVTFDSDRQDTVPGGFLNGVLILGGNLSSYGAGVARMGIAASGRIVRAEWEDRLLDGSIPDDPTIRRHLDGFYLSMGRVDSSRLSQTLPAAQHQGPRDAGYVGATTCQPCHAEEFNSWIGTKHADAMKTLHHKHRHFSPRCIGCHVVGYGSPDGYRIGDMSGRLAAVQCESCHGPGKRHAQSPTKATIRRTVDPSVCLQCHDEQHSDSFEYTSMVTQVNHQRPRSGDELR
ncbi:MAG TPA: multiheme c-type cytochrome [Verrucomicrobiae bacterium]|nr:multiheme c-type cytochrome [Verrucomicrobiae bacterium]